jgi:hypothetical protein
MKSTILACIFLLVASAFGQTWDVEQVDSTALDGTPVELVKTSDGRLWACYQAVNGFVRIACRDSLGWRLTDVVPGSLSAPNRPLFAAGPHDELCFCCYTTDPLHGWLVYSDGDTWRRDRYPFDTITPSGTVAFDSSGRLHTGYNVGARFWSGSLTDTGWVSSLAGEFYVMSGSYEQDVGVYCIGSDNRPWYMIYTYWEWSSHIWGLETALMHFNGDTWTNTWNIQRGAPVPLALVPHGDSVTSAGFWYNVLLCDYDTVSYADVNVVAGLAYNAEDVPLAAYVPRYEVAVPVFASRTNRWHTEAIPSPAGTGGIDIETDAFGRPVIVYATPGSGLWCAVGTDVVGTEESSTVDPRLANGGATMLSGTSGLKRDASSVLFDATGRRVTEPKPGVYFLREPVAGSSEQYRMRKVIIVR